MNHSRWLVVLGALLVQPCLGAIYAWGVFVPALKASRSELTVTLSAKLLGVDPEQHRNWSPNIWRAQTEGGRSPRHGPRRGQRRAGRIFSSDVVPAAVAGFRRGLGPPSLRLFGHRKPNRFLPPGIMVFSLVMIFAGRWQDRVGPRRVAMTGGLVLAAGYAAGGAGRSRLLGRLVRHRRARRSRHRPGLCLSGGRLREMVSRFAQA